MQDTVVTGFIFILEKQPKIPAISCPVLERLGQVRRVMLKDLGLHDRLMSRSLYLGKNIPIGGTAHQAGTARFGRDAKTSALDLNCKAHDLDNLYVVDASFFVSIAAVNPSLTIIANALRVGDHLLERLG